MFFFHLIVFIFTKNEKTPPFFRSMQFICFRPNELIRPHLFVVQFSTLKNIEFNKHLMQQPIPSYWALTLYFGEQCI